MTIYPPIDYVRYGTLPPKDIEQYDEIVRLFREANCWPHFIHAKVYHRAGSFRAEIVEQQRRQLMQPSLESTKFIFYLASHGDDPLEFTVEETHFVWRMLESYK